jgi:excisionase family DNA binding protein
MSKVDSEIPELMTVQEVARYLRLKERKIYDLLAQKRIPCTRVSGKWLFPRGHIDEWLRNNSEGNGAVQTPKPVLLPQVVLGSHDPLLAWALAETDYPLALQMNGSTEGLERFAAGEGVVCGLHLLDAASGEYNIAAVRARLAREAVVLIHWAWREQGLLLAPGNPLGVHDLVDLASTGARIVERQEGAGSRLLFRCLLERAGVGAEALNILPQTARGHVDVGLAVCSGQADVGIAVSAVARQMKLDFLPLARERFDLVIRRRDYFEPAFQRLWKFCGSQQFAGKAQALGGYDISGLGSILYNAP